MKYKLAIFILLLLLAGGCASFNNSSEGPSAPIPLGYFGTKLLADFNTWDTVNNVGGEYGSWAKDPNNSNFACKVELTEKERIGEKGNSLKIKYSVDAPFKENIYNGFWMKLNNTNFKQYKMLVMYVKGDKKEGFPPRFKVELKNVKGEIAWGVVSSITHTWTKIVIPYKEWCYIENWKEMEELVFVFTNKDTIPQKGVIYIDNIYLSK